MARGRKPTFIRSKQAIAAEVRAYASEHAKSIINGFKKLHSDIRFTDNDILQLFIDQATASLKGSSFRKSTIKERLKHESVYITQGKEAAERSQAVADAKWSRAANNINSRIRARGNFINDTRTINSELDLQGYYITNDSNIVLARLTQYETDSTGDRTGSPVEIWEYVAASTLGI